MDTIQVVATEVFSALDTPLSLSCEILMRYGEWEQLASKQVQPSDYIFPAQFKADAQAVGLLKKLEVPGDTDNLKLKAKTRWLEDERKCHKTNLYLKHIRNLTDYPMASDSSADQAMALLLRVARKKVKQVIGTKPFYVNERFGPGSTFQLSSSGASILHKLVTVPEMTEGCANYAKQQLGESAWFRYHAGDPFFNDCCIDGSFDSPVVRGNRWTTVPKSSIARRSIAVEPVTNLFLQLGAGGALRARLQQKGLLLVPRPNRSGLGVTGTDSQRIHKRWAQEASRLGDYATVDLSSASDTICTELVRSLLPDEWFKLLDGLRSPATLLDDGWHVLEKFSSMGNGFTFELETLIFWAICEACGELIGSAGTASCYGDDIIIPSDWADTVYHALAACGFTVNTKKSFKCGPFRESCGGDYYLGFDVRPVQITAIPQCGADWFVLHNQIARIGEFVNVKRTLNTIRSYLPNSLRKCGGDESLGDIVLHGVPPSTRWNSHEQRLEVRTLQPQAFRYSLDRVDERGQIVAALYGAPSTGVATREIVGHRIVWI